MRTILVLFAFICAAAAIDVFKPIASPIRGESADDVRAFWTPERMKNAIPLDNNRQINMTEIDEMLKKIDPQSKPGRIDATYPDSNMNVTAIEACALSTGYAPAGAYTTYPWRAVGKVFFTQGTLNYVCSGASIHTYGIVTAGHCVYSTALAAFSTNFIFVPGYNNNFAPFGIFPAYQQWVFSAYTTTGNWCYDYAFVSTCTNAAGQQVGALVGTLGLTWNQGLTPTWRSLGYPQAAPFNGLFLYYCDSSLCTQDSACTQGIACNTTGGASGGPWVIGWNTNNLVNSVNSYVYDPQLTPPQIFGPYFDGNVPTLYTAAFSTVPPC